MEKGGFEGKEEGKQSVSSFLVFKEAVTVWSPGPSDSGRRCGVPVLATEGVRTWIKEWVQDSKYSAKLQDPQPRPLTTGERMGIGASRVQTEPIASARIKGPSRALVPPTALWVRIG